MPSRSEARLWPALALAAFLASCGAPERPATIAGRPVSDVPVKLGKPYQVAGIWYYPADQRDYDAVGLASWYGPGFHGGPTANGERFDADALGAAHKTLPLPCYVEVTALDTGRTIVVRVNDRGPFVGNRIIDLSRRSALLLGIERGGVARVRVRRVEPPEADRAALRAGRPAGPRPDSSPQLLAMLRARLAPAPATRPGLAIGRRVQVAAYADRARADAVAALLGGDVAAAGDGLWRVRVGPYFDDDQAREALARLQGQGYQDAHVVR